MSKTNIILTGGHAATTAIATVEQIKLKHPDWNLYWVGPKSAVEGKYVPTLASTVMPKLGIKFVPIVTGRLQRKFTIWTIPSLLKIPYGVLQSFFIILKIMPKEIISFGGYASVPVCFAALIFRIPIIIHEQTTAAGLANKMVSKFANKVAIARNESARFFPREKIVLIGNPIRKEILSIIPKTKLSKVPTLYITGGSSGSVPMNKVIDKVLTELLKKYNVIHQTGKIDYQYFKLREGKNYQVFDFIDMNEIPKVFEKADFIVSRAGANTVSEIMIIKRPSILVPIPWVQNDEQTKNAKLAEKAGIAILVKQDDFNEETLTHGLMYLEKNWKKMANEPYSELAELDRGASERFINEIELLLK